MNVLLPETARRHDEIETWSEKYLRLLIWSEVLDVWQGFGDLLSCVEVGVVIALLTKGFSCLGQCCFDIAVRDDFERGHVFFYDLVRLVGCFQVVLPGLQVPSVDVREM